MSGDNEELIARIRNGDADAVAAFIEVMRPQLTAFIERQLGATRPIQATPDSPTESPAKPLRSALPVPTLTPPRSERSPGPSRVTAKRGGD